MKYILSVILAFAAVFIVINSQVVSGAVSGAVSDCLEIIVPSLFAFTVLAIYLQKSGLYRIALKPATFLLSKILRLDEELCAVFVLANIGGFPVGASLLSELTKNGRISEKDAGRMLCCCFGSGPSFVVGIVGIRVFGNAAAGLALFAASLLTSFIMAVLMRLGGDIPLKKRGADYALSSECFISSVMSGARVMFTVCAMITGFSVISSILNELGVHSMFGRFFELLGAEGNSSAIFPAILEISRVKSISPTSCAMSLCAALLNFGGVCVLLQISALARGIPLKRFLFSRLLAAIFGALAAIPLSKLVPSADVQTLASAAPAVPFTKNAVLSLFVLVMCGILLVDGKICFGKGEKSK